jgi:hypothetical protein
MNDEAEMLKKSIEAEERMISEEEKQKMIAFLRNPQPIELHFEKADVPPDLFWAVGPDGQFHTDDEDEYEDDEISVWPDRIVKSGKATIVFWEDGTKTVVKRSDDEPDNEYNAYLAALGKRIYGSNSALKRLIRDYTVVQKPKKAKDACPIDKPCEKSTIEHDLDALNEQAKKQYEEYLAADKWTCPKCGRQYHWQKNDEGRYAFCPKCQLASKDKA